MTLCTQANSQHSKKARVDEVETLPAVMDSMAVSEAAYDTDGSFVT